MKLIKDSEIELKREKVQLMDQIQNLKSNLDDSKKTQESLIRALETTQSNKIQTQTINQQHQFKKETEMIHTIKNLSSALDNLQKRCDYAENKYDALKKS